MTYMLKYEMLFLKSKEIWHTAVNLAKGQFSFYVSSYMYDPFKTNKFAPF